MENNFQTIIMTLVAIIVFFIFPTYVAYEKKDDLSYALSLKYTQNFVDNVRSKGYVSNDMYKDYILELAKTGNSYDVELQHTRKIAVPVTNYFQKKAGQDRLVAFKNQESRDRNIEPEKNPDNTDKYSMVQNSYRMDEELIVGVAIVAIMKEEDFYQMNVGDEFAVILKNTNTTIATILYNLITIGKSDTNTRIYINYGGSITNETWTKAKAYKEYEAPITIIGPIDEFLTDVDQLFSTSSFGNGNEYKKNFVVEFKAFPTVSTELPVEGSEAADPSPETKRYNFLIKDNNGGSSSAGIGVTVGVNGLAIIVRKNSGYYYSILTYNAPITKYTNFRITFRNNEPTLHIDGVQVAQGIYPPYVTGQLDNNTEILMKADIGQGHIVNQHYVGRAMNFKFYNIQI